MLFITPTTPNLPPLPEIRGDDALDLNLAITSHPSLQHPASVSHPAYGSVDRLAELGCQTLRMAAAVYYYGFRPMLSAQDMVTRIGVMTGGPKVHEWLEAYGLKNKFSIAPHLDRYSVLSNHLEMEKYFYTYVGAMCHCNGVTPIIRWVAALFSLAEGVKLEDMDVNMNETSPPYEPNPPQVPPPPLPGSPSPAADPSSIPASVRNFITVAHVNEMASKMKVHIDYTQDKVGQDHNPQWTVRCIIDGEERGRGTAAKTKTAKELAAQAAYMAMGWHPIN